MGTEYRRAYEACWDMPLSEVPGEKHIPHGPATAILAIVSAIVRPPFRLHVDGLENLDELVKEGGVVLVANHTSYLDVVFLYVSMWPRHWARFIAKNTLFDGKPYAFGWILAHVGAFPIHRDTADRTAIKRAARMLKNGEIVVIMPEGTRRGKSDITPEIHGGAALIARMGKAPILPATVRNAENIKRKGERLRFPKVSSEFGTPILLEDFDFLPKDKRLDGCMWYAMREVFALSRRCAPEDVDMTELFPGGEDFTAVFAEHEIPRHTSAEVAAAKRAAKAAKAAKEASDAAKEAKEASDAAPAAKEGKEPCA